MGFSALYFITHPKTGAFDEPQQHGHLDDATSAFAAIRRICRFRRRIRIASAAGRFIARRTPAP